MLLGFPLAYTVGSGRTAEAEPMPALACALQRAELIRAPDWDRRAARAVFVPRVGVGARTVELGVPGLALRSVEVFAWLRWPTARHDVRSLGVHELGSLAARRQALADEAAARLRQIAAVGARPAAAELHAQLDDRLDREEAEAELAALSDGEPCP